MTPPVTLVNYQNAECQEAAQYKGNLQGRSVVVVEGSKPKDFNAGMGPLKGLDNLPTVGVAFATLTATVAVALATLSLKSTGITLALGVGATILTYCFTTK